jgi:hypothetical protein
MQGDTMALLDIFRQHYMEGKVLDKYRLDNDNIGLIVENRVDKQRYHVDFSGRETKPGPDNLYGLLKNPYEQQSKSLDRLISKGDYIGMTTNYNRSPFKQAQQLHTVSATPFYRQRQVGYSRNLSGLLPAPYR